jgi:spermidine synthase
MGIRIGISGDRERGETPSPDSFSGLLYSAFFLSGAASLLFEVLWIRRLALSLGNSPFSFALASALSIGGLGAGAFLFPRLLPERLRIRRRLPAGLEATFGTASFSLLRFFTPRPEALFLCAVVSGAVISSVLEWRARSIGHGGKRGSGSLFGVHFLGAALGAAGGGLWFLPRLGSGDTLGLALGASILSSLLYLAMVRKPLADRGVSRATGGFRPFLIPATMVWITGAAGLGIQVLWGRWISQMAGSSAYTYYSILSVAILAFGAGCLAGTGRERGREGRGAAWSWGWAGLFAVAYPAVILPILLKAADGGISPFRYIAQAGVAPPVATFLLSVLILFPPLFASGAMFSRFVSRVGGDPEREAACFFSNCLGACTGGLAVPFLLVPAAGMGPAMVLTCALNAIPVAAGISMERGGTSAGWRRGAIPASLLAVIGGVGLWMWGRPAFFLLPQTLAAYAPEAGGRRTAGIGEGERGYYREGPWSTVLVGGARGREVLVVDGKPESSAVRDRPTQAMLAHLPFLLRVDRPGDVLLIGLGSGATLEAVLLHDVRRVDCVEISREVVTAAREAYGAGRAAAIGDPRVRVRVGDGRRHLREGKGRYDVIISQPSNPWVMGASSLFTREAFQEMASSLAPFGVAVLWFQAYGIAPEDVRREVETVRSVFPEVLFFSYAPGDILMVCSFAPMRIDAGRVDATMARFPRARDSLAAAGISRLPDLLGGFFGGISGAGRSRGEMGEMEWNTDDRPRLEYSVASSMLRRDPYPAYGMILSPLSVRMDSLRGFPGKGDPRWGELAVEWGEAYGRHGFARFAGDLFEEALAVRGPNARILNDLGVVRLERRDYNGAVSCFEQAIAMDPGNRSARENLSILKKEGGDAAP